MRALFKWLGIIPLLLSYLFVSAVMHLLPVNSKTKRGYAIWTTSFFSRLILVLLGVRVHVKHPDRLSNKKSGACLIVSNHLSYVDVLVLSSLVPSAFITSIELKNTALLGTVAKLGGSIFVERRKATGLKQELESISFVLGQGFPVALFPEGTTSNGDRVMQFKKSLFDSAVVTRVDIFPVCLRYTAVNHERLTEQNRDAVFYYGGVAFFKHLPRLLSRKSVDVEVIPLRTIKVRAQHSRKDLADMTHNAISTAYHGR